jgi:hypothetical protein
VFNESGFPCWKLDEEYEESDYELESDSDFEEIPELSSNEGFYELNENSDSEPEYKQINKNFGKRFKQDHSSSDSDEQFVVINGIKAYKPIDSPQFPEVFKKDSFYGSY